MFDFLNNSVMENRTRNKKTVRRLLDKYGTLDNFMQNGAPLIVNRALNKLKQTKRDNITDEDIIREFYKQRTEYVASLPESKYKGDRKITAREKHNIITKRYPAELREALSYLNK